MNWRMKKIKQIMANVRCALKENGKTAVFIEIPPRVTILHLNVPYYYITFSLELQVFFGILENFYV
jgi:hypothetical protein